MNYCFNLFKVVELFLFVFVFVAKQFWQQRTAQNFVCSHALFLTFSEHCEAFVFMSACVINSAVI